MRSPLEAAVPLSAAGSEGGGVSCGAGGGIDGDGMGGGSFFGGGGGRFSFCAT
jgi:hypothetical protein